MPETREPTQTGELPDGAVPTWRSGLSRVYGPRGRRFTLVELMAVMVVIVIVVAITLPAFNRLTTGIGVEAGARMVGGNLRLARQYAISLRKDVALLMPSSGELTEAEFAYSALRVCEVTGGTSTQFVAWIENTKWEYLPLGAVIAEADADRDTSDPPADGQYSQVIPDAANEIGAASGRTVRAVLFRKTGRMNATTRRYVTIAEGAVVGGSMKLKNKENAMDLAVDLFTGRVSYEE